VDEANLMGESSGKVSDSRKPVTFRRRLISLAANLSLVFSSIIISLVLAEVYLRLFPPGQLAYIKGNQKHVLILRNPAADPVLRENGIPEFVPGRQIVMHGVTYAINAQGWRDYDYLQEKPADTFRIVAIGDSYTFGHGVGLEDLYTKKLEKLLNERQPVPGYGQYEVLSMGMSGLNTVREAVLLRERGFSYQPDLVLINFVLNDLEDYPLSLPCFSAVPDLIHYRLLKLSYLYLYLDDQCASMRMRQIYGSYDVYLAGLLDESRPSWGRFRGAVEDIARMTQAREVEVLVVIFPMTQHRLDDSYIFTEAHGKVASVFAAAGIPVLDLLPVLRSYGMAHGKYIYAISPYDYHPNAEAHQVAAEAIYQALLERGLIASVEPVSSAVVTGSD
jgi:lysophospholipase L1-like esterase